MQLAHEDVTAPNLLTMPQLLHASMTERLSLQGVLTAAPWGAKNGNRVSAHDMFQFAYNDIYACKPPQALVPVKTGIVTQLCGRFPSGWSTIYRREDLRRLGLGIFIVENLYE